MKPHLRYLRYVLLHKSYVLVAGVAIKRVRGAPHPITETEVARVDRGWFRWLWRLLVHDWSKFRPSEWAPYVANFYGPPLEDIEHNPHALAADCYCSTCQAQRAVVEARRARRARFDRAWLQHQHRNPHHWQHWVLREDSGKTLVLLPPSSDVDEMVADWIGAGSKILRHPTLAECIGETVVWYTANVQHMLLRDPVRHRVEETLMLLSARYGLVAAALQVRAAERARASIVIPGR